MDPRTLIVLLLALDYAGALTPSLGRAAAAQQHPTRSGNHADMMTWLGAAVQPDVTVARRSEACGGTTGLFATRALAPGSLLARVPCDACLAAADACDDSELGPVCRDFLRGVPTTEKAADGVVLAMLLVQVRYGRTRAADAARERWGPYVDSLPWADGDDDDPLAGHPLARAYAERAPALVGEEWFAKSLNTARVARTLLEEVHAKNDVDEEHDDGLEWCSEERLFRAVMLIASRSIDLSAAWVAARRRREADAGTTVVGDAATAAASADALFTERRNYVMVPYVDLANHPSVSAIKSSGRSGARFADHTVRDACVTWALDLPPRSLSSASASFGSDIAEFAAAAAAGAENGCVVMRSPPGMAVEAGDELWNWYGDAGWGAETTENWERKEEKFVAQYGFSPWK